MLELHEVMARLKGLQLALLAHADQLDVSAQADGPAPVNTAAWLAHRALVAGRTARRQVRHSRDLTADFTLTGSALLAGDIDATQAEVIVWAVKRLPEGLEAGVRETAEKVMLAEALRLDAVSCGSWGTGCWRSSTPPRPRSSKPDGCVRRRTPRRRRRG